MTSAEEIFDQTKTYLQQKRDSEIPQPVNPAAFRLPQGPKNNFDLVYPGIYIGNYLYAKDPDRLKSMGVTHVVNCAQGSKINQINTDEAFFEESGIKFYGIPAVDTAGFDLSKHFISAADFLHAALQTDGNKVYVHCREGISRSSTIVLAFLMLKRDMRLLEAVTALRAKREIFPNTGFLKQLSELDISQSRS